MRSTRLRPLDIPFFELIRAPILLLGMIDLPLCLGKVHKQSTHMIMFMVINHASAYNIIMRRVVLNAFCVIPLSYHITIKFMTTKGVRVVSGHKMKAQ